MQWVNRKNFDALLGFALSSPHSSFYRNKYAQAGLSVSGSEAPALSSIPLLERAELEDEPVERRLFVPQEEVRFVAFTSGTTSKKPLMLPFADVENYFFEPSLGLTVSRPLVIHPPMMRSFSHTFLQQCRQAKRPLQVLFGDVQNPANSALLASLGKCDSIYGIPTIVAAFIPHARARGVAERIRLVALSSETLTAERRRELQEGFPHALIANLYGSAELGQLPFVPCQLMMERGENRFHILTDALAAVEIIDGELVVSYGLNRAMPLIRYRTGDYMEALSGGCACGREGPVLQWSHRANADRVRLNGVQFDVAEADRAFSRLGHERTPEYQVHFEPGEGTAVRVRIEVANRDLAGSANRGAEYAERLEREFPDEWRISPTATLRTALERGLVGSVTVEVVERVSAPGLKAKRFVNHVA